MHLLVRFSCFCPVLCCFARVLAKFKFDLNLPADVEEISGEEQRLVADHHDPFPPSPPDSSTPSSSVTSPQAMGGSKRKCGPEETHRLSNLSPSRLPRQHDTQAPSTSNKRQFTRLQKEAAPSRSNSPSTQPADNVIESGVGELRNKKANPNLVRPDILYLSGIPNHSRCLLGDVSKRWFSLFESIVNSKEFKSAPRPANIVHPDLPFAMVQPADGREGRVLRVMRYEDAAKRKLALPRPQNCVSFGRRLIVYLNHLHLEVMERLGLPESTQILLHDDFLKWVHGELFHPSDHVLPVLGTIDKPYQSWEEILELNKIGKNQEEIIKYFSGDGKHEEITKISVYLLETYQDHHENFYLPSSYLGK
ncbi:hypothetical protein PGT21_033419 [Puccinia graminis f. sp. tritici]|uniref:Uncharacterized protein n=1 Tax=Puccinia graminis f. sp. tritici TaxID=56615 RepID=A0A5B0M166_PUCGR|nr:hypothetical protein PGT21_033419 [Puccinia graminis f. sp. tritici]